MADPSRARSRSVLPAVGGVVAAIVLVGVVAWSGLASEVLVPAGTLEVVPAYVNGTALEGGLAECQQHHDCGHAGVLEIGIELAGPSAITGTLEFPTPLTLAVANGPGLTNLGSAWWVPPPNGSAEEGGRTYESSPLSGIVDLGALQFNLSGANNVIPGGSWTLCLVNWGLSPVTVTVVAAVTEAPR